MATFKHVVSGMALATVLAPLPALAQERDTAHASGDEAIFQLSLWDSVQIVDQNRSVRGLRLTLPYGANRNLSGLDLGIATYLSGELTGLQVGGGGYVDGNVTGVQYNWILSITESDVAGVQHAIYNSANNLEGVQIGIVNHVDGKATGARLSLVNVSDQSMTGFELGAVNYAPRASGLQLGLVNVTEHLNGVQIGIVNVARNGFLPVFPVLNAAL